MLILLKFWKEIAALIIAAICAFYIWNLNHTITEDALKIGNLTTENVVLKDNNDKLQNAVTANNAAITKLSDSADATKKSFAALGTTVKSSSANLETRLKGILAAPKPLSCPDAMKLLLDAATTGAYK